MSQPLPLSERLLLIAELDARIAPTTHPRPHPSLPEVLAPGSNVAYVSKAENDRLVSQALALGLGQFRVSEHDHRLAVERELRRRP